jgi:hypothetical protein
MDMAQSCADEETLLDAGTPTDMNKRLETAAMSPCRALILLLSGVAAAAGVSPVGASSPEAWAAHRTEVVAKCSQASGLRNARLMGRLIEYDDSVGFTAALIVGTYPQPHMKGQPGKSLCLFDKRSRTAQAAPADDFK